MVLRGRHENDAGSLERCALADGGAEERGDAREGSALKQGCVASDRAWKVTVNGTESTGSRESKRAGVGLQGDFRCFARPINLHSVTTPFAQSLTPLPPGALSVPGVRE